MAIVSHLTNLNQPINRMRLLFTCLFIILTSNLFAQQKLPAIVHIDTINLRGIIYKSDGKPAVHVFIYSKQKDLTYGSYSMVAMTDSDGRFVLKGAKPNDTLDIETINHNGPLIYLNKGSRFMAITLPPEETSINANNPVTVTAARRSPKVIPSFKLIDDHWIREGTTQWASFPGGAENFFKYIKKNLAYPEKAVVNNIEGEVEIAFSIERDGSLFGFNIVKGIGYGCDEEVIRLLKVSPKWKPGILGSRPAVVHHTVTVEFKLTDK